MAGLAYLCAMSALGEGPQQDSSKIHELIPRIRPKPEVPSDVYRDVHWGINCAMYQDMGSLREILDEEIRNEARKG